MVKFAVVFLFIFTGLMTSLAEAHGMDACCDPAQTLAMDHTGEHAAPSSGHHECPCQSHHHNCTHQFPGGRPQIALMLPLDVDSAYLSRPSFLAPFPFLEGPFQPPRA